jgi:hypothetical protein
MIKVHRWTCKKCDDKLFLRVDDQKESDMIRLTMFESYVSRHVIITDHEMSHIEKEEKGFNII